VPEGSAVRSVHDRFTILSSSLPPPDRLPHLACGSLLAFDDRRFAREHAGKERAMGIKERIEQEAKDLATRAGEILKEKGEELLADAKDKLADKVSDIVDEQKTKISDKLTSETKKK
jgi:gas vesicle protein